jgi:quinoprotein glucose dehydrogenase
MDELDSGCLADFRKWNRRRTLRRGRTGRRILALHVQSVKVKEHEGNDGEQAKNDRELDLDVRIDLFVGGRLFGDFAGIARHKLTLANEKAGGNAEVKNTDFTAEFRKLTAMLTLIALLFAAVAAVQGAESQGASTGGISDPARVMGQFRLPPGFSAELFAAEPHLANPVAFTIDHQGNFYVAETHRHSAVGPAFRYYEGVLDIRSHLDWLDEDLALQSVPERTELLVQKLGTNVVKFTEKSEILRLIQDKNGDGKADSSSTFASGFNRIPDGIAAGVLAREGKVLFACIPDLWQLEDTNADGKADKRESLHTGYGVHVAFLGHDLHGLVMGPDGRLYFSIGDRGINVTNNEGRVLFYPDEGVVLRCESDGANLEVFARGLRNPQELAFDDFGNLFTGDNNSDGGDRARWVHVVEGGDSGWRIGYQHMHAPPRRGPWNAEKLWYPQWEGQAAYIVPPLANLGYGPSGLTYYPGTGLPEKYRGHFFLCDFRGGASSGIHTFTLKPKGASFELSSYEQFLWEALPTDAEFGPDGALYFTDWIQGWNKTGGGRIYRIAHPESRRSEIVAETRRLLREGMTKRAEQELCGFFTHPDRRVRQEAQFELAKRGLSSVPMLHEFSRSPGQSEFGELHLIWALGHLARKHPDRGVELLEPLRHRLTNDSPVIRATAAKAWGEAGVRTLTPELVKLLNDPSEQVQFAAAMALPKIGTKDVVAPVLAMLERNADRDPFLRHAGVMALAGCATAEELDALPANSRATQLAVLLALRRQESPLVAKFLASRDILVVLEAARAINDVPIKAAMPLLAQLITVVDRFEEPSSNKVEVLARDAVTASISSVVPETGSTTPYEQLFHRVINANFRLGEKQHAAALAKFATHSSAPANLRAEGLQALAEWPAPSGRDRVMGLWRPLPRRAADAAMREVEASFKSIFPKAPEPVQLAAIEAVQKLGLVKTELSLVSLVRGSSPAAVRVQALKALAGFKSKRLEDALQIAAQSGDPALVNEARLTRARFDPESAAADLVRVLASGSTKEKQQVLSTMAAIPSSAFANLITAQMQALLDGRAPAELELDILDAAAKQGTPELLAMVQQFEAARPRAISAPFREVLRGGDAQAGRAIFFERAEVYCSRCHMVGAEGGLAGPNLTGIGARQTREYLLDSIVFPNKELAKGFENVLVTLNDAASYSGAVTKETSTELVINSPEDGEVRVKKSDIKSRERALSGMPEEFRQILTKHDLRNLIEFLASQK